MFPSVEFQARLVAVDPSLKDLSYAAETYDAVTLAVLAAAAADDDSGRSIAANLLAVSGGTAPGTETKQAAACTSYKDCVSGLRTGAGANYDGQSGPIGFDASGDITSANFMVFTYGADNKAKLSGRESAGRAAG